MQDGSGEKTIEIDVRQELNNDVINFVVEVTDETQRTYNTTASCTVVTDPVKINFDEIRTDKVFRPGLPLHAVVKIFTLVIQFCIDVIVLVVISTVLALWLHERSKPSRLTNDKPSSTSVIYLENIL